MIDLAHLGDCVYEREAQSESWRSTAENHETDRMMRRRRDFELMLGEHPDEVSDEQRMRAWELAEAEPGPDRMTSDQMRACYGRARDL